MFQSKVDEFVRFLSDHRDELDEWYLSDFIDEHVSGMAQHDAFDALSAMVPYLQQHPQYGYELLEIVQALHRVADTTQVFYGDDVPAQLRERYTGDDYALTIIQRVFSPRQ